MAADGSIIIDTRINTSGFDTGAASLKSQFVGLGSSVKKLGGFIAAAFSIREIVAFGKEAISLGSDLQEVQNVVDVTFTTLNEQVNEFAQNAAFTAGLSETMAKRYVGTFGAMSKSFGFTEEEAYNMSTALTQLAGDVASFHNLSQDEAYTKLKSVFTGETESLKDLGVVMTQTALDDFAMRRGFGKTTNQMSEQEKVALRYQFVMEQLNTASGDFLRTSTSWANQTKLLSLQFESLKATIGQGLINVFTPVIQVVNALIGKLQTLAVVFRDVTAKLFGDASGGDSSAVAEPLEAAAESAEELEGGVKAAGKAAKKASANFDELNILQTDSGSGGGSGGSAGGSSTVNIPVDVQVTDNVSKQTETVVEKVRGYFSGLAEAFTTLYAPAISSWGNAFSGLVPHVQSAGSRISAALSGLWNNSLVPFGSFIATNFIPSIVNAFSTTFAPIFSDIMPVLLDTWATDFENQVLVVQTALGWLKTAFNGVKVVFADMCAAISANWDEYGGSLLQGFTAFKESLWEIWWNIYDNIINPVLTSISETVGWLWNEHLKPLWDSMVDFFLSVGENALALWNRFLKPLVDYLVAIFSPIITNIVNIISRAVAIAVSVISDIINGLLKYLSGFIQFLTGVFTLDWERAWGGIKKMFEGSWTSFVGIVKGVVNTCILAINTLFSLLYSGIAGIVNGLGSIVSTVGDMLGKDWGFSMPSAAPQIPYLAKGAVIPPNAPFMAVLGDQKHGTNIEAPLDTIKQALAEVMATQSTGGETNVTIRFTGDLAQLARVLKPVIDTETRRKGTSLAKGMV